MSTTCLFCGGSEAAALTNEHINPQWLLEYLGLPADDQMFQGVASSETEQLVQSPRVHSSFSFVHGRVCETCNGGWMSRLETAAKPILIPLMEGEPTLDSLPEGDARIVSKWAAKTAYLHTWAGPLKDPVQLEHLKALYGDLGLPVSGVSVFAMQSDHSQPSAYIQTGHWPQLTPFDLPGGAHTPVEAYKIGLQYRRLYLLVAYWPNAKSILTRQTGVHIRLHPLNGTDETYEISITVGDGPIDRLKAFTEWLAVTHTTPPDA